MKRDPGTVVAVEDNPQNMKLLERVLAAMDYRMVGSEDGEDIVGLVVRETPCVVLMDIQLPRRNGVELLEDLKADPRTTAVPVVAVTATADPGSLERFARAGFAHIITKPIAMKELLTEVARHAQSAADGD